MRIGFHADEPRGGAGSSDLLAALAGGNGHGSLRAAMDLLPVGVLFVSGDSAETARIGYANPALAEIVGTAPEPGTPLTALSSSLYLPDRRTLLPYAELPSIRAIARGETSRDTEVHVLRPDGTWRVTLASASPALSGEGMSGAVSILHDVTERRRLNNHARYLASFPEENPNPVLEVGLDGRVSYANPAARALFPDPMAAGTDHPLLHGIETLAGRFEDESVRLVERDVRCGDLVFRQAVHYLPDLRVLRLYCQDVTERTRAEEERKRLLKERETQRQLLEAVVAHTPAGVAVLTGPDHRYALVSRSQVAIARGKGRLVGRTVAEVWPEARGHEAQQLLDRVYQTGESVHLKEVRMLLKRGADPEEAFFNLDYVPLRGEDRQVEGIILFSHEITELVVGRRNAEIMAGTLEAANEQLQAQSEELQAQHEELQAQHEELQAQHEELQAQDVELRQAVNDLRESEERYRGLVEMSPDAIFVNRNNEIVFANPAALALFGAADASQLLGRSPFEVFHPSYHPVMRERIRRLLEGERVALIDGKIVRLDGSVRDAEVAAAPFHDQGRPAIQVIVRDTTERKQAAEALRRSEQRLRAIIDNADGILWLKDLDGRFLVVNEYTARLLGRTPEEIVGRTVFDLFPPDVAAEYAANDQQVLAAGMTVEFEERAELADGCHTYVSVKFPLLDATGRAYAVGAICADITERKRMEEALRHREGELRLVMDAVPAAVAYVDADCRYRRVNRGYEQWFQWRTEDVQGRHAREVLGEAAWQVIHPYVERVLAGEPVVFEREMPAEGEGTRWEHVTYTPDRDEAGNVRGFVAHIVDISELKRTEEARTHLAAILDATPDFVGTADVEQRVLTINRAGRQMVGLGEDEDLTGMEIRRFHPDWAYELLRTEGIPAAVRDGVWAGETALLSGDGREIPVSQVCLAHRREDGSISFLSTIARDLSGRRQLEEELRQAQKMEAVGRLAGGVAHDFNNMLMPIMTYSQLLCDSLDPGTKAHRQAVAIAGAAERAADLPRQLLAFSRKQIIQPKVLDLNETVSRVERMLRRLIGEDIVLTVSPDPRLGKVLADPSQIDQVLLNLVVNARDAMPDGGKLTIETRNVELDDAYTRQLVDVGPGRYVMMAVSDTGCGMDAKTRPHIFEPFFTTKEQGKGTGLGLSTVYGIVKQSDGEIHVYSEPGNGTTFRIYLPRLDPPPGDVADTAEPESLRPGSETVLVVEDADAVRDVVRDVLEEDGYTVIAASNGQEGLRASRSHQDAIHLLLTDVVMPGMSGRQLADQLATERPGTRVIFMSGYTEDAIVRHGVLEEGIAFIQKPFTPGALLRKVREVLGRPVGS